jgi:Tfp pilus assembly protein PilX
MNRRRTLVARNEEGWVLVTAIILMAIMLSFGLATFAFVDNQQRESGIQRTRETAFNFAEGTLTAQVFGLTRSWPGPGSATNPVPTCTPSSTDARCPAAATLASLFSSADTATGATWQTAVRDNGGAAASYYSDQSTASQPGYDANGDGRLWVRAQATARGKTRTLVALARVEEQAEDLPRNALIAGRLSISNNGRKVIIDGEASASPAAAVRCTPALLEPTACLGHRLGAGVTSTLGALTGLLNVQINGTWVTSYSGGNSLSVDALARIKARTIADGTYFPTCPTEAQLLAKAGKIVWIESGNCVYDSNAVFNSQAEPGALFLNDATLRLDGTIQFHGLIYGVNPTNSGGTIVQIQGDATVRGGVLVDGQGMVIAGSSKLNIQLDDRAFAKVKSYGTAGIIQNTWREILSS